jgi:hypothetical protein
MRTTLATFAILLLAFPTVGASAQEVDLMRSGFSHTARATFEPESTAGQPALSYSIERGGTLVSVRLLDERMKTAGSLTQLWTKLLQQTGSVTVRFGEPRELSDGESVPRSKYEPLASCLAPRLTSRQSSFSLFSMRCIAFDTDNVWRSASGALRFEADIIVAADNGSPVESYFRNYSGKLIYVRVE